MFEESIIVEKAPRLRSFCGLVYLVREISSTFWYTTAKGSLLSEHTLQLCLDLSVFNEESAKQNFASLFTLGFSYTAYLQLQAQFKDLEKVEVYLEEIFRQGLELKLIFSIGEVSQKLSEFIASLDG